MKRFWLFILWLVFSPAFFFISKRYEMKSWKRWLLTIISPSWLYIIPLILILILIILDSIPSKPLEFEKVKFNTPEKVIAELGIKDFPKMTYTKNTVGCETIWGSWYCLVEFQFEDSLSIKDKEAIIKFAKSKDEFQWNLPEDGVVEYFNIKYGEKDTIPYNIVITNDKVYVAYDNKVYYPDLSDIFSSNDYRLLAERTWLIGPDSSHEYVVKFNQPYSHYINELKKDKTIDYKETSNTIMITKNIYSNDDSTYLQEEYEIEINKKKNTALINYGTF